MTNSIKHLCGHSPVGIQRGFPIECALNKIDEPFVLLPICNQALGHVERYLYTTQRAQIIQSIMLITIFKSQPECKAMTLFYPIEPDQQLLKGSFKWHPSCPQGCHSKHGRRPDFPSKS